jgi:hypothetical protein
VSKIQKLLEQMKNHQQDWTIADVLRICNHFGVHVRDGKGSHVYLTFANKASLSLPAKRPIKPVYIIQFLDLLESSEGENQ